jgi:hypothetical protein
MLALLAAVAAASTPAVGCATRAEPSPPQPTSRHWVVAGPMAWAVKHRGANEDGGTIFKKAGVSVDAGKPVTVRVLTRGAGLHYRRSRRAPTLADADRVLRFKPCPPDTPSFSEKGETVGLRTGFAGMLIADRRKCVRVRVRRGGRSWVASLPVGTASCRKTVEEGCSSRRIAKPMQGPWVQPSPYTTVPNARTRPHTPRRPDP